MSAAAMQRPDMPNAELHDQIEDLEAQIESFAEVAESCKKWILLSKIGTVAGGIALLTNILGFIFLDLRMTVLAIAAVLGGIALGARIPAPCVGLRRSIGMPNC
jgi:hypothetical protein